MIDVLLIVIPIIIGIIGIICKLKKEGNLTLKSITGWGWLTIGLSLISMILAVFNLVKENEDKVELKGQVSTLLKGNDSLTRKLERVEGFSKALTFFTQSLGYKIDTTEKNHQRTADSLFNLMNKPISQSAKTVANVDICINETNLKVERINKSQTKIRVELCNYNDITNNVKIDYWLVVKKQDYIMANKEPLKLFNFYGVFQSKTVLINDITTDVPFETDTIYLFFKGTYKDQNNKTHTLSRLYRANNNSYKFAYINEPSGQGIREYLKSKGVL